MKQTRLAVRAREWDLAFPTTVAERGTPSDGVDRGVDDWRARHRRTPKPRTVRVGEESFCGWIAVDDPAVGIGYDDGILDDREQQRERARIDEPTRVRSRSAFLGGGAGVLRFAGGHASGRRNNGGKREPRNVTRNLPRNSELDHHFG